MSTTPYIPEEFTQYLSKGYNKFLGRKLLLNSNELLLTDNLHIKCKVNPFIIPNIIIIKI